MGLTRIGGMSFCNISINNMDFNLDTYKLMSVDRPSSPTMTYRQFTVPKRHGSKYYSNRYEDIEITVVIGVHGNAIERQQKITYLLQHWIGREDKLFFHDRPNLFYYARFFDAVPNKDSGTFSEITIRFICSYCMYEVYGDLRDYTVNELTMSVDQMGILVNHASWENITSVTNKSIINSGNFESQPLIELSGKATLFTLEINGVAFSVSNLEGSIYIDCENMNVYKINENKKVSVLTQFIGDFPVIPSGRCDVYIGGKGLNLSVTIDFKNTYIV